MADEGYKKLDPEFKTQWLEALRSGNYQQATETLRVGSVDGQSYYCCLGVACDVMDPAIWAETDDHNYDWGSHAYYSSDLDFVDACAATKLVDMNDETDLGFKGIADWIEDNL